MSEWLNPVAGWLLTYALHSTLLLGGVLLVMSRLHSAALRDLLCKLATFAALLTATAPSVLPRQSPVEPLAGRWELPAVAGTERTSAARAPVDTRTQLDDAAPIIVHDPATPSAPARAASKSELVRPPLSWPLVIVCVWLVSALAGLLVFARKYVRVRRRFARRRLCTDAEICGMLDELRRAAGIKRAVKLTLSDAIVSPVALGRREVCVPAGLLAKLGSAQQRTMLAHELAHVARRDPAWLLAFGWIEAVFLLQPLNRLARREFQRSAEQLCDQFALRQTEQPIALAQCLAEVASWLRGNNDVFPYPAMVERASPLLRRVERVLQGAREPLSVSTRTRWLASTAVVLFAFVAPAVTGAVRLSSTQHTEGRTNPSPLQNSGDIAAAVRSVGTGVVRFAFVTRTGVCGTGEEKDGTRMFALQPTREWLPAHSENMLALYVWDAGKLMRNDVGTDGKWTTPCLPGVARADLGVEEGSVARVDLSVADPAPRLTGVVKDIGQVEPTVAAAFLVQLARGSDRLTADRALLGAILARNGVTRATLRELGSSAPHLRTAAQRWLEALDHGAAGVAATPQLPASPELRAVAALDLPFARRQAALEQATRKGLLPSQLMTVYERVPDRAMRVELIDWLSAREDESVREFLKHVERRANVWEEQQAALHALAQSADADARGWALERRQHQNKLKEDAPGRPQSPLAQRIVAVRNGLAHVTYDVRPEACGSGIDNDGAGMFALLPTKRWKPASVDDMAAFYSFDPDDFSTLSLKPDPSWTKTCQRGPGHLLLVVREGKVNELRIAVGAPLRSVTIGADLGRVPGPEAAQYLLELAGNAHAAVATNAILAAVMAGGDPLRYPELVRIATDLSRPEKVRGTALHWAALDPTPGAGELLRRNMESLPHAPVRQDSNYVSEPRSSIGESNAFVLPMSRMTLESAIGIVIDEQQQIATRKKAIDWVHTKAPRPGIVAGLYDLIDNRELELYLLDYLGRVDNEQVARKLIQIAEGSTDGAVREAAMASLRKHTNSVAKSYR